MPLFAVEGSELMLLIGKFWWPFVRFSALLWSMPMFDGPYVTPRARILLAASLALLVATTTITVPAVDPLSIESMVMTLEQIVLGVLLGLAIRILFGVATLTGTIVSMQMGLAMAVMMDPGNDQAPLVSQLFWLVASLCFLGLDGHLIVLAVATDSFQLWPIGTSLYHLQLGAIIELFGWMFTAALLVSLPAIITMLLVNMTFGVASRAAPSLNIFVLGFPVTLLLGLIPILLMVYQLGEHFFNFTEYVLFAMRRVLEG